MPITNWDDLRIFVAIGRAQGIAAAARALRLDHSTVVRRLAGLEEEMGTRLADRLPTGIRLTSAGTELFNYAERMEAEAKAADLKLSGVDHGPAGVVRLATPEAFGTFLVAPGMSDLYARFPELQLELVPEAKTVSLSRREADIAVVLARPTRGRLYARKLTEYRLGLYASTEYLDRAGPIQSAADLLGHPFVSYIDELIGIPELRVLEQVIPRARVAFRSSSLAAQQYAVAAGMGIGLLHGFAASGDERLIPILPDEISVTRTYWMAVHSDLRGLPRIAAVLRFIEDIVAKHRARIVSSG